MDGGEVVVSVSGVAAVGKGPAASGSARGLDEGSVVGVCCSGVDGLGVTLVSSSST